jgi:hypothetical protein
MSEKKPNLIEAGIADFMSIEKFRKAIKCEPKSTVINYAYLKQVVMSFDKINPEDVVLMMEENTPLMIRPLKSDSGIVISNIIVGYQS